MLAVDAEPGGQSIPANLASWVVAHDNLEGGKRHGRRSSRGHSWAFPLPGHHTLLAECHSEPGCQRAEAILLRSGSSSWITGACWLLEQLPLGWRLAKQLSSVQSQPQNHGSIVQYGTGGCQRRSGSRVSAGSQIGTSCHQPSLTATGRNSVDHPHRSGLWMH